MALGEPQGDFENPWKDITLFTLNMTICWAKFSRSKAKDASSDSVLQKRKKREKFFLMRKR